MFVSVSMLAFWSWHLAQSSAMPENSLKELSWLLYKANCSWDICGLCKQRTGNVAGLLQSKTRWEPAARARGGQVGPARGWSPQGPGGGGGSFAPQPGALRCGRAPRDLSRLVVPLSHCAPAGALDDGWRVLSMGRSSAPCFNSVRLQAPNIARAFYNTVFSLDAWFSLFHE